MKQEDKELLLKDLCARLPYGLKIRILDTGLYTTEVIEPLITIDHNDCMEEWHINSVKFDDDIKPYLRPMSSMTEEEKEHFDFICSTSGYDIDEGYIIEGFDWLNAHHLDYRELIEKGLALEAPEGMY